MPHSSRTSRRYHRIALVLLTLTFTLAGQFFPGLAHATFDGTNNVADKVLGQIDFNKAAADFVDAQGLSLGFDAGVAINETNGTFSVTSEAIHSSAGVAVGLDGKLWVADTGNNRVLGWPSATSFANGDAATIVLGQPDFNSYFVNNTGGLPFATPTQSSLAGPTALAVDPVSGNLWVADTQNNRVLVFEQPFTTGMLASVVYGQGGVFTSNGGCNHVGTTTAGALCQPQGIAIDPSQDVFIVDTNDHRVVEYDAAGANFNSTPDLVIGQPDFLHKICNNDGLNDTGKPPSQSSLCLPGGIAVDAAHNVYLVDRGNNRVLEYTNPLESHSAQPNANLVFGQPSNSFTTPFCDANTAPPTVNGSLLCGPHALALDANGNLWISDSANARVLEYLDPIGSAGGCTPQSDGSGCPGDVAADLVLGQTNFSNRSPNFNGNSNPPAITASSLSEPEGIATLPNGGGIDVFVVDNVSTNGAGRVLGGAQNDRVLRYKQITGNTPNGPPAFAILGQLNFSNFASNLVDRIGINGQGDSQIIALFKTTPPTLLEGLYPLIAPALVPPLAAATIQADAVIPTNPASQPVPVGGLNSLESVFVDSSNHVFITDSGNNRVLGWKNTVAFTNGQAADLVIGQTDFNSSACNQGLAAPTGSTLCEPMGLTADSSGNLFVTDLGNNRVLEFNSPFLANPIVQDPSAIRVFGQAGKFNTSGCDTGGVNATTLCQPIGVALDSSGDLYVSDFEDSRILEYNSPLSSTASRVFGQASTTAKGCNKGTNGSDIAGLGTDSLCQPIGMALDSSNDLYVTDAGNSRVLEYLAPLASQGSCAPSADGSGCAGDTSADLVLGQSNFTGNSCLLNFQGLCFPTGVALDPAGNTFVADSANSRVVEFDAPLNKGEGEDILFGQTLSNYTAGFCNGVGDVGVSAAADSLCYALGVAFDKSANLYVADAGNNRVLEYNPPFGAVSGGGSVTGAATTTNGPPGNPVALGSFTVTNSLGSIEFLSSADITVSNPSNFSALTLTAGVTGSPSTSPSPISATTTFGFGTPVQIPPSSQVTFTLTGTLAAGATAPSTSVQNVSVVNATAHAVPVSFSGLPALMDTLTVCGTGGAVALVTSGTGNAAAGSTVPAGTFSVTNMSCGALPVTSVALSLSNPTFFSGLGLSGGTLIGTIGSTTTFALATPPIPAGGSTNFALTATVRSPLPTGVKRSDQVVSQVTVGGNSATGVPVDLGTLSIPPGKLGFPVKVGFGLHKVGVPSRPKRIIILSNSLLNRGPINISQVILTDNSNPSGAFKITSDGCTNTFIFRGQSCKLAMVFTATAKGAQTGTITIKDNATNSPQTINLLGWGS
jgi:sugar lactone lactonase YvrE